MPFRTSQKKSGSPELSSPTSKISKVISPAKKFSSLKNVTKCFAVKLNVWIGVRT